MRYILKVVRGNGASPVYINGFNNYVSDERFADTYPDWAFNRLTEHAQRLRENLHLDDSISIVSVDSIPLVNQGEVLYENRHSHRDPISRV